MDDIADLLKEIEALLRREARHNYDKGYMDGVQSAKSKILAAIGDTRSLEATEADQAHALAKPLQSGSEDSLHDRKRAPRGLPRALTTRVLRNSPNGATPQQIVDAAETDFEKMIAVSSIRSELRRGQEIERYIEVDGIWHLSEGVEAEDRDLDVQPSASDNDNNNGGTHNAAAITQ